ncbi:hypothetical protein DN448_09560 [Lactobacillus reuteri]|nr:hypothetical protein [Limosilactobacillus reuteri]MQB85312.1 hypothetical protein [Limosilactobacillus reuteri]
MIPDVTPNGVFYLPPTGWLTSFYNPPNNYVHRIRILSIQMIGGVNYARTSSFCESIRNALFTV